MTDMFISINGAYPITAPHQAPWLDVVGNTRTDPSQYVSDIAFMAQGNAVPVGEPPDYDASTSVLIWENGWMVRPKTVDELTADRTAACVRLSAGVTAWLDSVAADRQYDGIHALVGYATSSNTAWKAEAQAGIAWRDASI